VAVPGAVRPGTLVVAAGRIAGQPLVAPVFVALVDGEGYLLGAARGLLLPGTPIFTVDGEALALAGDPALGPLATAVGPALDRLRAAAAEIDTPAEPVP
jgi:hypothetical protein